MQFGIVTKTGDAATGTPDVTETIFCTHQHSSEDATPLQMVSAEQVAYWMRIEAEYLRLLEGMAEVISVPQTREKRKRRPE